MTFFVSTDETRAARDGRYARMQTVRDLLGQSGLDDFVFEPFDEGFHMGIYDKLSKKAVMYRVAEDEEAKDKLPEILKWFATSRGCQ